MASLFLVWPGFGERREGEHRLVLSFYFPYKYRLPFLNSYTSSHGDVWIATRLLVNWPFNRHFSELEMDSIGEAFKCMQYASALSLANIPDCSYQTTSRYFHSWGWTLTPFTLVSGQELFALCFPLLVWMNSHVLKTMLQQLLGKLKLRYQSRHDLQRHFELHASIFHGFASHMS